MGAKGPAPEPRDLQAVKGRPGGKKQDGRPRSNPPMWSPRSPQSLLTWANGAISCGSWSHRSWLAWESSVRSTGPNSRLTAGLCEWKGMEPNHRAWVDGDRPDVPLGYQSRAHTRPLGCG